MTKYYVIAKHWDDKAQAQKSYIAGEFDRFANALIFKDAYNELYNSNAIVVNEEELLNAFN